MVIHIDRLWRYGSQLLVFERENLVDVPDPSQKITCTDGGTVGNDNDHMGTDSQELEKENGEALSLSTNINFKELELDHTSCRTCRGSNWDSDYQFDYTV